MRLLFLHQNFPGQFKHLVMHYAEHPEHEALFISKPNANKIPGVHKILYKPKGQAGRHTHRYLRELENAVWHGQAVAEQCVKLRKQGKVPDIVLAHPAWGESLFIKEVFPDTPLLNYFEYYFDPSGGGDVGFDPEYPPTLADAMRLRMRNSLLLQALESSDWGITPTHWQWSRHPEQYQSRISIIHEGVDTQTITPPRENATYTLPDGRTLGRADEVITYVARNLEPYRGFPSFMRAAGIIHRRRPKAIILVVGGDGVSYGQHLPRGQTYRQVMLDQVKVDPKRIYFLGRVPYERYLSILKISAAHIYLTYPFVLSWSMLEAMASGCLVIGSNTGPVTEVIHDGHNGLLTDFFSPEDIADRVAEVLAHPNRMERLRAAARRTIIQRYDLRRVTLPRQISLIELISAGVLG